MVNGPDQVYVERSGKIVLTDVQFVDETHLRRIIDKIVSQVGRRVDEANPMVDARLPDGSRVNVIVHPLAIGGPFMTIRKFADRPVHGRRPRSASATFTPQVAHFIDPCVRGRLNVVVSGGTGTGKTTLLNVLSSVHPRPTSASSPSRTPRSSSSTSTHVLPLEARPPNIEGKGEVKIRDLVRNSLRMRPDRIVVGEVRGGEALDMLQAMNTGHDGSITTVHSNSPRDTLSRIETMTLMAGMDLPVRVIREQMASALDLDRPPQPPARRHPPRHPRQRGDGHGGRRRRAPGHLHRSTTAMGIDEDGKFLGAPQEHRHPPVVLGERLADYGISLEPSLFAGDAARAAARRRSDERASLPLALDAATRRCAGVRGAHRRGDARASRSRCSS